MADIEIKRGYEVLPDNNIRFGIRVINNSEFLIVDVEVILDYSDSLFKLEGNLVHNLGIINPTAPRTAEFVLKPLACIHKEEISATVRYKDHTGKRYTVNMHPKEVHCVCPFLKEKAMTHTEFLDLSKNGYSAEAGLNFHGVTVQQLSDFLVKNCKNRHYKVDEFSVDGGKMLYLASESIGEKATYLITAFIRETDGLAQVMLKATSDKPHGLNGFLNEMVETLRHIVSTVKSAREIGIIKKEQVINIIDSVVQRTSFEMGGEGASSINSKDSVVQRTEFNAVDEEKKNREDEERLKRNREEQREEKMKGQESRKGSSGKFFVVALVLGVLLLGIWAFTSSASDAPENSKITPIPTPKLTPTVTQTSKTTQTSSPTPEVTQTVAQTPIVTPIPFSKIINVSFMYAEWGSYQVISYNEKKYFAGYTASTSNDITNVPIYTLGDPYHLIFAVLIDDNTQKSVYMGSTLTLNEGYVLKITDVDTVEDTFRLSLLKDGEELHTNVIQAGNTYIYSKKVGSISNLPIIAVHFDSTFFKGESSGIYINGIFQLSESDVVGLIP